MLKTVVVIHYHELWLKGRNRKFFLGKFLLALRRTFADFPTARIRQPGDRVVLEFDPDVSVQTIVARLKRVFGIAYFAVARSVQRGSLDDLELLCRTAWDEVAPLQFSNFAVRAKRSDKSFPHHVDEIERRVGKFLLENLRKAGRNVRVQLDDPELTCRIEITPGPMLAYAKRIPGTGGLPPNTTGRMLCLLSGGFDSAVAAYKMMRRGAHVNFVHFWGGGARPGESSVHVARALVERLVPYQFTARLYLVSFESIQREIVRRAPEQYRLLLYRRMMLRIAEQIARRNHAQAIITGDSLGQVASQTLQNMVAVGAASPMPVFRPLAGDDKQDILALARHIGTFEVSEEPFHDCCPLFLPRSPALYASAAELDAAENDLNISELTRSGLDAATLERYSYAGGRVERIEAGNTAIAMTKSAAAEAH
ncbi:MAG TPA: tRNA uracil 4-sulfurtransferase ThiI [Terriglobales bacterium]|nr:tRNA uracil 4-sulfurtransferase ThiI [Terriglobales bacterium]